MQKKTLLLFAFTLLAVTGVQAQSRYDLNGDGAVNVGDVTMLVNDILGKGSNDFSAYKTCPDNNHPHTINMGSAGLWLCCNLGSATYDDYGSFFTWGDAISSSNNTYNAEDYVFYNASTSTCTDLGSDISGTKYDVAMAFNPNYRTPTQPQFEALLKSCEIKWLDNYGRPVVCLISKENEGGVLFMPTAGFKIRDENVDNYLAAYYWTSSTWRTEPNMAAGICLYEEGLNANYGMERWCGVNIRPMVVNPFDLNGDGHVNVGDVTKLVNVILGKEADESVDAAVEAGLCPDTHHPHVIDMGVAGKWACCNVDVDSPTEWGYGGYYAWGETFQGKSRYDETTYKYKGKDIGTDFSGNPEYDVATKNWDASWAMPTAEQSQALIENCTYEWTSIDGKQGGLFTAPNGKKIFLPAKGWFGYNGQYNMINAEENAGYYWTASSGSAKSSQAYAFSFNDSSNPRYNVQNDRAEGLTIRPVAR